MAKRIHIVDRLVEGPGYWQVETRNGDDWFVVAKRNTREQAETLIARRASLQPYGEGNGDGSPAPTSD